MGAGAAGPPLLPGRPEAYGRARKLPFIPDEPVREADRCPDCGNPTMQRHYRYGPAGTVCCPNCGWDEVAF